MPSAAWHVLQSPFAGDAFAVRRRWHDVLQCGDNFDATRRWHIKLICKRKNKCKRLQMSNAVKHINTKTNTFYFHHFSIIFSPIAPLKFSRRFYHEDVLGTPDGDILLDFCYAHGAQWSNRSLLHGTSGTSGTWKWTQEDDFRRQDP